MYPRNAASPPRIAIGSVVQISDGAVQSSGVSVVVRAEGGAESAGGGAVSYGALSSIVYYAPIQGETNHTAFVVTAYKTGCIPVSITVVTTATAVSGTTRVGEIATAAITADSIASSAITSAKIASGAITSAAFAASSITASAIASSALSITKFATDIGTTAYASNPFAQAIGERLLSAMVTSGSFGKKIADIVVQTGDAFARLGEPAGASIAADIATRSTFNPTTDTVVTDAASRTASKADVSSLATAVELAKVPKKDVAQTWTNQAGDTHTVTVAQV